MSRDSDVLLDDAILAFCEQLPQPLRGPLWNHIRPAMSAAAAMLAGQQPTPPKADEGRYMVSVDGGLAPTKVHDSLEAARAEAARLASRSHNRGARIRVLLVVDANDADANMGNE